MKLPLAVHRSPVAYARRAGPLAASAIALVGALPPHVSAQTAATNAAPPLAQQSGDAVEGVTVPLAAVVGRFSTPPPGQRSPSIYAADLGWVFTHGDALWSLFGDSWADPIGTSIRPTADDALGKISLRTFPDGDAAEAFVASHPAPSRKPRWQAAAPTMAIAVDGLGRALGTRPTRDGVPLSSGVALAPVTGFSNGRRDDSAAAFAIFLRNEPVQCSARGTCDHGFSCDATLGRCAPVNDLSATCVLGTTTCNCVSVGAERGLCVDRGSSLYSASSERGRSIVAVMRQQVGNALRDADTTFASQSWDTHRFFNVTARTVDDFEPARPNGIGNDYRPAAGDAAGTRGVFVWGRPSFGGVGAQGRDAHLYLAWVPMPSYDRGGRFFWQPRFFAGLSADGVPLFSALETDAKPLDLDADVAGEQPEEQHDIVGQMSISWVPALSRFVMIYGGDLSPAFLNLIFGPDAALIQRNPLGALYIRYADHPWGPWTPPKPLVNAGDPQRGIPGQYGPGGVLHHPTCRGTDCAPSEPAFFFNLSEPGRLYGPAIIDAWTETRADRSVDLYWHMSTWNPYQVLLMKTSLPQRP